MLIKFTLRYVFAIILILYSFTVGIFTKKGRVLLKNICDHYGFTFLTNTIFAKLPIISFSDLIDNKKIILVEPKLTGGNIDIGELAIINGIVLRMKPKKIFEIGTFDGRTTFNMATVSPEDCVIYTLDLPRENISQSKFKMYEYDEYLINLKSKPGMRVLNLDKNLYPQIKKINQLYGDSGSFDFTEYYNSFDIVFIDAAHNYDYVINDSEIALKLLRNGKGIILWHDYEDNSEVVRAVEEIQIKYGFNISHISSTTIAYLEII